MYSEKDFLYKKGEFVFARFLQICPELAEGKKVKTVTEQNTGYQIKMENR